MLMDTQLELVKKQFSQNAAAYVTSATHNDANVPAELVQLLNPQPTEEALDIATGPGTVGLALAPHVQKVVVFDATPAMLEQATRRAKEAGYDHFEAVEGMAEELPFPDDSFDIVTVRTAPHHYSDIQRAVNEMSRVVKPTGRVMIVDTSSPEDMTVATEMNDLERLRDASHVWNYMPSQWHEMLAKSGLKVTYERNATHAMGKRLWFNDWTDRMKVTPEAKADLWKRFTEGSAALRELLEVSVQGDDLSFTLPEITLIATR
ncbi:class I SAM-dependent methyltransferase [soil metagenome]